MWLWLWQAAWAAEPSLQTVLIEELDRATARFDAAGEVPHYVAVTVEDWDEWNVIARDGTLAASTHVPSRSLDVDLRTGSPELDSTHPLRGFSALEGDGRRYVQAPLDEGYALRHALWQAFDSQYRRAVERIVVIRANQNVKVAEETPAPDFETRTGVVASHPPAAFTLDIGAWEETLVHVAQRLDAAPEAHVATVALSASRVQATFVDTEGARLVHGRRHARVSLTVASTADDGDEVTVFRAVDVHDPERLPDLATLNAWADQGLEELRARLAAPRGEPYSGPVLLNGQAAAVFFHEVLGHRVEGHRQKRDDEGRTFADHVGRAVLPSWLDVYDDPTVVELAGHQLNGHYSYDDEGVAAARAELVQDGMFVGFLMGRSPIPGFIQSNGHGRRSSGNWTAARMGNTIIEADNGLPPDRLRARLLELVRAQGLEFGTVVDEIEGGFTMTGRVTPNAFNVRASTTYRVYADGRPDELVRGVDLVGTPLVAFGNLVAAGDDPQVFNGSCGAESGWVPVSAVSPSLLFRALEFQLKEKGQDRPPLLPKPAAPATEGS